jgi:hypothetical protein
VFWCSLQSLSETFLILRWFERDVIKNVYWLHVKYALFLSYFHETWIFLNIFPKSTQISNFVKIRLLGGVLFHAEGQSDKTKLIAAFSNFASAPNRKVGLLVYDAVLVSNLLLRCRGGCCLRPQLRRSKISCWENWSRRRVPDRSSRHEYRKPRTFRGSQHNALCCSVKIRTVLGLQVQKVLLWCWQISSLPESTVFISQ